MKSSVSTNRSEWKFSLFSILVFVLFFQLTPDFIESVYVFGLLGTEIPPEIISILLFFSPVLLLFFARRIPLPMMYLLAILTAAARAGEVLAEPSAKMLASGFGVGCLFLLLPSLLFHSQTWDSERKNDNLGLALFIALSVVILLRTLGAGSDISLIYPWVSWLIALGLLVITIVLWREGRNQPAPKIEPNRFSGKIIPLCIGFCGCLMMLYFAFISPTVLSRWSELDYRLIVGWLALCLLVYFGLLSRNLLDNLSRIWLWIWNAAFIICGVIAIMIYQEPFPSDINAYPFYQTEIQAWQHVPLMLFIALCPVIFLDFTLLKQAIHKQKPSPRALGIGFVFGALFFLLITLMQVFTAVYDYIPVIGPWFRDRFWLVFLLAGLGMCLPVLATSSNDTASQPRVFPSWLLPIMVTILVIPVIWAVFSEPTPDIDHKKPTLTVMTYNIQQGYSIDGKRNYEGQMELIRSQNPDILGLQESDTARFMGGNADVVRTFSNGLGMYAYYGPRTVTGTFGIALLSRYPIENPRTFFMYSEGEQTASIEATITVNDKKYWILVTHLGNDGPMIQQQNILQMLQGKQNVIAMGDFNFKPDTEQYRLTTQTFADAWVLVGSPLPPTLQADHLIDHVFVSPDVPVQSVTYIDSPAADHPALVVEINK